MMQETLEEKEFPTRA